MLKRRMMPLNIKGMLQIDVRVLLLLFFKRIDMLTFKYII